MFIVLLCSPVYALTGISLGVKGGLVSGVDLGSAEYVADIDKMTLVGGQFKITTIPYVDFIGTVEYSWGDAELFGGVGKLKFHDLSLNGSVVYPVKLKIINPYVGLGIGTHANAYSLESAVGTVGIPDDKSYFGYHFLSGFDLSLPALPISFTGELRYNWIKSEPEKSRNLQLTAGVNWKL
jgi:hypothetical protein